MLIRVSITKLRLSKAMHAMKVGYVRYSDELFNEIKEQWNAISPF